MLLKSALAERTSLISESTSMKVAAGAGEMRSRGVDVVDFAPGEPDFPTPDHIKRAAIDAIDSNFTKYTPAGGTADLKKAICERHRKDFGTDYSTNECIATVGGKHAVFNLVQALVGPGDEVIIPVPYWVTFKDVVNYAGGKCVFAMTDESQGFAFTAKDLQPYVTSKTKLLILNSPCNPSGAVLTPQELEDIYLLAKKHDFWVLTDECYCHFIYDGQPFSIAAVPKATERVVVVGSVSKTYSMTGWRIGFAFGPKNVIDFIGKLQSHSTSNPTSIAQKAAIEALTGPQGCVTEMLAEYRTRRDFVMSRLSQFTGLKAATPQGAFYVYPNVSGCFSDGMSSGMQFAEQLLLRANVAVVPGEAFGTHQHVRMSYATSMAELSRGLDRIWTFVQELKNRACSEA